MIKEFTLGATKWKVKEVDELISHTDLGECNIAITQITISKNWKGEKVSKECKETTVYHEALHAMLDTLGYYKLSHDEKFVQSLSVLMQQFEQTKK
jgi:hypothetical protein